MTFTTDEKGFNNTALPAPTDLQLEVSEPVLDFLMNVKEENIYTIVPEEKLVNISGPEDMNEINNDEIADDLAFLEHLTNRQKMTCYGSLSCMKGLSHRLLFKSLQELCNNGIS